MFAFDLIGIFGCLFLMPLLGGRLGISEAPLIILFAALNVASAVATPFATGSLPIFFCSRIGAFFNICLWSAARSLFTRVKTESTFDIMKTLHVLGRLP